MEIKLKVIDIIEKDIAVSTDDATKLYEKILEELKNHVHKVELSFQDVTVVTSHFLSVAIGCYAEIDFEVVDIDCCWVI